MEIFISKAEDVGLQLIHKGPLWQVFSNESFQNFWGQLFSILVRTFRTMIAPKKDVLDF